MSNCDKHAKSGRLLELISPDIYCDTVFGKQIQRQTNKLFFSLLFILFLLSVSECMQRCVLALRHHPLQPTGHMVRLGLMQTLPSPA